MSVNGISNNTTTNSSISSKTSSVKDSTAQVSATNITNDTAVVYEASKNNSSNHSTLYKKDYATIQKLKEDADRRTSQLRNLVEKMLLKQGQTMNDSTNIYDLLRNGDVTVDPEVAKQAKEDISEDGYWGVNQTSERLFSFAQALTGGDPSKIDEMRSALAKGFEAAKKAWGGELPSICQETYDATLKKFDEWANSANQ